MMRLIGISGLIFFGFLFVCLVMLCMVVMLVSSGMFVKFCSMMCDMMNGILLMCFVVGF